MLSKLNLAMTLNLVKLGQMHNHTFTCMVSNQQQAKDKEEKNKVVYTGLIIQWALIAGHVT